ncbi:hypothetical protein [Burkholderia territorii]|uniref:hypothetical protein n=1 Tax=Burkholderia territorii TaxID=1503055 RepID=UPI0012D9A064|nr:hypothetical protein [Burkholderia territorii]
MNIIKACWASLAAFDCQYGAHIFDGKDVYIYVNNWLGAFGDVEHAFHRCNDEGFVGRCILVFKPIKRFDFDIKPYAKVGNFVSWGRSISFNCTDDAQDVKAYELSGSLHGFASSVSISVEGHEI